MALLRLPREQINRYTRPHTQTKFWQNQQMQESITENDLSELTMRIREWAAELGFQQVGITDVDLGEHEAYLQRWLAAGHHGSMEYMDRHGNKRSRPDELEPGTRRVISLRMDYLAADTQPLQVLESPEKAYISRYTLGRDYHKLIRKRLAQLAGRI